MIPKFRAWHEQGFMLNVENIVKLDLEADQLEYCVLNENGDRVDKKCCLDEIELMQSIGLKDENRVDIYEGDLVEYRDGEESFKGEVVINCFGSYVKTENDYIRFEDFSDENTRLAGNCYVVGNVYENKEQWK